MSGGTTHAMMTPVIREASTVTRLVRFRNMIQNSSAVASAMVRILQHATRRSSSNIPITVLVLPTSIARSMEHPLSFITAHHEAYEGIRAKKRNYAQVRLNGAIIHFRGG